MRNLHVASLIALLASLTACQTAPSRPEPVALKPVVPAEPKPAVAPAPSENLSIGERIAKGIAFLQTGDTQSARREFEAVLVSNPKQARSRALLKQIDADPVNYLGSEHFEYKVQSGDTMALIAKRFLGEPLNFFVLARYNGIQNPSQLEVGQALKIPGTYAAASTSALPDVETVTVEPLDVTNEQTGGEAPVVATTAPTQTVSPANEARAPENAAGETENRQIADESVDATTSVSAAADAPTRLSAVDRDLVESYHKQAMVLYRQQLLNEAIELWDKAIALDPTHEQAITRRANAVALRERIKKF